MSVSFTPHPVLSVMKNDKRIEKDGLETEHPQQSVAQSSTPEL